MHIEDNSLILGQAQSLFHHTEHKGGPCSIIDITEETSKRNKQTASSDQGQGFHKVNLEMTV